MSMDDLIKLIKILAYTTSTNDNEALSACRRANSLMKSMNLTWEQLVKEKTIVVNEIINVDTPKITATRTASNPGTGVSGFEVEIMLKVCMSKTNFVRMSKTGQDFINSLNDWYNINHHLTDKQVAALKERYNNI